MRKSASWQRLRDAKKRNMARRFERYKIGKSYHGIIKALCRKYRKEITTPRFYVSTSIDPAGVSLTEAARQLALAERDPWRPVVWIIDKTDAEEWQKTINQQITVDFIPDEREAST